MIPLFLSLLAALILTQAPAALADDLKEDSSGERPSRGPLSLSPLGQKAVSVQPSHLLPAWVPGRRKMWKLCGQLQNRNELGTVESGGGLESRLQRGQKAGG